ncbi:MAG: thiamine phosphate synthase [Bacteroidia bacterium]|nr:thiamine phosphate synthase [Bacteroidia bacterium]
MRLIVITSDTTGENEQYILLSMLKSGLPTLHIRKPTYSTQRLRKYLDGIPSEYHKRIVIHTHHRMLLHYDLKGIHLTKMHKRKVFRNWLTQKLIAWKKSKCYTKSTVCNSISSLVQNYHQFDYMMLTPVFGESSEHKPAFSIGTLSEIVKKYPGKVIARGGTNIDSIARAKEIGFEGIAFQNCIWKDPDPLAQFQNIIQKYNELGLKVE